MGFFDKALKKVQDVGENIAASANNVKTVVETSVQDTMEITGLKRQIRELEKEMDAQYLQIGKKYAEFVADMDDAEPETAENETTEATESSEVIDEVKEEAIDEVKAEVAETVDEAKEEAADETIDEVKAELEKGDCKPGVCGPRVRTVTACQGNQICPSGNIDSYDIAQKLDERYFARELPHKFKFGVTGCQNNCLKSEENDVGVKGASIVKWKEDACIQCGVCVKACRTDAIKLEDGKIEVEESKCNYCGRCAKACPTDAWDVTTGYLVSFGGLFGNRIHKGEEVVPVIKDEETLFRVTDAAIQFFDDNANPSERFQFTIERVGEDKFEKVIKEAYNG